MRCLDDGLIGLGFPESLRWWDGALWFSDMFRSRVLSWRPGEPPVVVLDRQRGGPAMPGGLGRMPDGDLLVVDCLARRVLRVSGDGTDGRGGEVRIRIHADVGDRWTYPANDLHVDVDGTAWLGGYGFDPATERARVSHLIRIDPHGGVTETTAELVFPNGCERRADAAMLVAETFADRVAVLAPDGSAVRTTIAAPAGSGPDGLSIAPGGDVYVALAFGPGVVRLGANGAVAVHRPRPDPSGPVAAYDCAVHPDGLTLAVAVASADEQLAMRRDTGRIELIPIPSTIGGIHS